MDSILSTNRPSIIRVRSIETRKRSCLASSALLPLHDARASDIPHTEKSVPKLIWHLALRHIAVAACGLHVASRRKLVRGCHHEVDVGRVLLESTAFGHDWNLL